MTAELAFLTLFRATPAQVYESRKRTWPQWGGLLTEDQFLDRAAQMDAMEHAVNSRMITWVLAPRDKPQTLDFMCACETYKRPGLVRYPGSTEVQEVTCYGVASVFTPPHKRGKGYASYMMRLLHWVTSVKTSEYNLPQFPVEWGAPPPVVAEAGNGMFSILYSDVGEEFYKSAGPGIEQAGGWETRSPISTIWKIPEAEVQQGSTDSQWTWLKHGDLDAFWARDVQFIRRTMENLAESSPGYHSERPNAFVSFLPDEGVGSYHIFRSMFAADSIVSTDVWGCREENHRHRSAGLCDMVGRQSEFPNLLRHIQAAARKSSIGKMEIWNLPKHLLKAAAETGGQTFERKKALSGIKWYGTGKTEDIEWILNEK
ncbi:hypothetical protein JVT61DRAFT_9338 [Boletus reticuloceps]|uniref:LYC1 C-terminal domain-containing protein n=1 Tax=Boletus reticuloceps TaxID=495285 RepID=A0A8I2YGP9_9AGAM|nr:hypothetical protein JVT61DRAFT_9338 [Boletus reticuloceps]